jgi:hypothetical protein
MRLYISKLTESFFDFFELRKAKRARRRKEAGR